jgi:probable F420-dependent oxidoreductase
MEVGLPFPKINAVPVPGITQPPARDMFMRIAKAADEMDYHSLWLGEHIVRPYNQFAEGNDLFTWDLYDPYIAAGLIAAVTEKIKIAFGVLLVPFRNPIILAKMIATLDHMCEGRTIFGVGIGSPVEAKALGIEWKGIGRRTNEYLEAMRVLWASEQPVFHGKYLNVEGVHFKPKPVQERIPMWIGGSSDAAFRRMFRYGEGWHVARLGVEELRPTVERLHRVADAEGKNVKDYTLSVRPLIMFRDKVTSGEDIRIKTGNTLPGEPLIGPPDYVAEKLARYETELGITHVAPDLHDWWTGTRFENQAPDMIGAYIDAMEILATKVIPQLPRPVSAK